MAGMKKTHHTHTGISCFHHVIIVIYDSFIQFFAASELHIRSSHSIFRRRFGVKYQVVVQAKQAIESACGRINERTGWW